MRKLSRRKSELQLSVSIRFLAITSADIVPLDSGRRKPAKSAFAIKRAPRLWLFFLGTWLQALYRDGVLSVLKCDFKLGTSNIRFGLNSFRGSGAILQVIFRQKVAPKSTYITSGILRTCEVQECLTSAKIGQS
jgi:hypothetical protein